MRNVSKSLARRLFLALGLTLLAATTPACGGPDDRLDEISAEVPTVSDGVLYADWRKCGNHWYSYGSKQCYSQNEGGQWTSNTATETEKECCGSTLQAPSGSTAQSN